jgi:hypothetical protein
MASAKIGPLKEAMRTGYTHDSTLEEIPAEEDKSLCHKCSMGVVDKRHKR